MSTFSWEELLTQWSQEIIESGKYEDKLPPEILTSGWLGYPGATDEQITGAETRLGISFPPSYRQFLKVTNGWRMTTGSIDKLWSTEEVEWYATQDPTAVEIWAEYDEAVSDEEYLVYEQDADQPLRGAYFATALAVSDYGDGVYLLNPQIVTPEGEWEAWFFAPWLPGAVRYRSFWEMMQAEHESFLQLLKVERGEPTPSVDSALGVDAEDLEGLVAALKSPHTQNRLAVLQALGNLRNPRAFEPVLKIFQDPHEELFIREHAARVLGRLRDPRAVKPLMDMFRSPPQATGAVPLASLLGGLGNLPGSEMLANMSLDDLLSQMEALLGKAMADQLRTTLTSSAVTQGMAEHLQHAVKQGLLELGDVALPELFAALQDSEPRVRAGVALTLCYARGKKGVFEHLQLALADPDPHVRATVAANIEQLYDQRAVEPLLDALKDAEGQVRASAAISLGVMFRHANDDRILQTLTKMQRRDPDPAARKAAQQALAKIKGRSS